MKAKLIIDWIEIDIEISQDELERIRNKDLIYNNWMVINKDRISKDNYYINWMSPIDCDERVLKTDICISDDWNLFTDKQNAIKFDNKLIALKQIWKWHLMNDWFIPNWKYWEQQKIYITYNSYDKYFDTISYNYYRMNTFLPYFSTKEIAEKCIKECEDYLKILFDVD